MLSDIPHPASSISRKAGAAIRRSFTCLFFQFGEFLLIVRVSGAIGPVDRVKGVKPFLKHLHLSCSVFSHTALVALHINRLVGEAHGEDSEGGYGELPVLQEPCQRTKDDNDESDCDDERPMRAKV